jgi:hypothetical protein
LRRLLVPRCYASRGAPVLSSRFGTIASAHRKTDAARGTGFTVENTVYEKLRAGGERPQQMKTTIQTMVSFRLPV